MNTPDYITRTTSITVLPMGAPIYSETATQVNIADEAAGEYVEVCQSGRDDLGKIAITKAEWPTLRGAIDTLIEQCNE